MDLRQLAADITAFLAPFMPVLVVAGEASIKEIGKKLGESSLEKAKAIWATIQPPASGDKKLEGMAMALADNPDDQDFQAAFAKVLLSQLADKPQLAEYLSTLVAHDAAVQRVLVDQGSQVKDIRQRLSGSGEQKVIVRRSQADNISQEQ